ncbi:hypothetical protein BDV12DRAFT_137706 [Aspergillus spectabilis]
MLTLPKVKTWDVVTGVLVESSVVEGVGPGAGVSISSSDEVDVEVMVVVAVVESVVVVIDGVEFAGVSEGLSVAASVDVLVLVLTGVLGDGVSDGDIVEALVVEVSVAELSGTVVDSSLVVFSLVLVEMVSEEGPGVVRVAPSPEPELTALLGEVDGVSERVVVSTLVDEVDVVSDGFSGVIEVEPSSELVPGTLGVGSGMTGVLTSTLELGVGTDVGLLAVTNTSVDFSVVTNVSA